MTRHDEALPDVGRLPEAFADELDRPGLDGPSLDAVLRAGVSRSRRRKAAFSGTFAVAAAAAVAVTAVATRTGSAGADNTASAASGGGAVAATSPATPDSAPVTHTTSSALSAPASSATPVHPATLILNSGTADGHPWKLVREFKENPLNQQGCAQVSLYVDGTWTNAGSGGVDECVVNGQLHHVTEPADQPGFASITLLTPNHEHLAGVVVGEVNPATAKVVARCGSKQFTTTPTHADGDYGYYYSLVIPKDADCPTGEITFSDASGKTLARLTDVGLAMAK